MKLNIATSFLVVAPMASGFMAPVSKIRANLKATTENTMETSCLLYDPLAIYPESSEEKRQGRIRPIEEQMLDIPKEIRDPMGLYPIHSPEFIEQMQKERAAFDPMGLYLETSPERREGLIQNMETEIEIPQDVTDPIMGLYPQDSDEFMDTFNLERERLVKGNRELYNPLGLYPASSMEFQEGKIKALKPNVEIVKPVLDPMGLYSPNQKENEVDADAVMSESLPFMSKPIILDGELAGDVGFDPLGLVKSKEGLKWQRQAELKHSRIAMLAAAGWPLSELFDKNLATIILGLLTFAGIFEAVDLAVNLMRDGDDAAGFDPLGLYPKDAGGRKRMELAEIKHGRIAMMAITAFAAIEAVTHNAVVDSTPLFFSFLMR